MLVDGRRSWAEQERQRKERASALGEEAKRTGRGGCKRKQEEGAVYTSALHGGQEERKGSVEDHKVVLLLRTADRGRISAQLEPQSSFSKK